MSLRISSALVALLLTACEERTPGQPTFTNGVEPVPQASAAAAAAGNERIDCAIGGEWAVQACAVERTKEPEGLLLTIRHPDGGFRRLRTVPDGRGVAAADGAEPAAVTPVGADVIEVAIGSDRYRLPATIRR